MIYDHFLCIHMRKMFLITFKCISHVIFLQLLMGDSSLEIEDFSKNGL